MKDEAELEIKILSSPLRRCALTNKVLPKDLLVRFELTRPPPPTSPASGTTSNSRLVLTPSRMLHPRYEDHGKTRGKGLWVTCSREAVEGLANKGALSSFSRRPFLL
ncbi:hypothetical protein JCM11641_005179, partial [Rhodosporidiobolus odoratus]